MRRRLLAEAKIDAGDLDLLRVTDSPAEVCRIVLDAYHNMQ